MLYNPTFTSQIISDIESNHPRFQMVLEKMPLNYRPGVKVMQTAFMDVKKATDDLSFKLDSNQCDAIYKHYRSHIESIFKQMVEENKLDIKKCIIIIGLTCTITSPATIRILYKAIDGNNINVDPTVRALIPIIELLANLLHRREKIPEVQKTLEEIRDSSVNFILNYLATGNKTILNFSEDILVMMVARKLYNAMYWYMYGKQ